MQVTRISQARPYTAPRHFDMRALRLQGLDASDARFAWVGLSYFLPSGGAEMEASPLDKIYVVLDGEVTVELGDGRTEVLGPRDSCFIPGGEARAVRNASNQIASMIVIMPPPGAPS